MSDQHDALHLGGKHAQPKLSSSQQESRLMTGVLFGPTPVGAACCALSCSV